MAGYAIGLGVIIGAPLCWFIAKEGGSMWYGIGTACGLGLGALALALGS